MAGAGYKLFNTGDVLTAAQVNTYLQEQAVMRFANATARTTALSGVLAEGMMSYLDDINSVEVYNGSAWVSVGSTGDITDVNAGTGITVTNPTGPAPTVALTVPVSAVNGGTAQTTYTTGDLLYASGTNTLTKRAIGTTGQVLTVSGGVPTWSTPAASSSGMTLITTGSFSGNNATSINDCFSSTYENYLLIAETNATVSGASDLNYRWRVSGADNSTSNYNLTYLDVSTSPTSGTGAALSAARLGTLGSTNDQGRFVAYIFNPFASKQKAVYSIANRTGLSSSLNGGIVWSGFAATTSFTGITLYAAGSGTTFTGTYYIYGLAKA